MDLQLIAGLPDPSEASFIPITAVIGAVVASTVARLRKLNREKIRTWTEDGAYAGALLGLVFYLLLGLVVGV